MFISSAFAQTAAQTGGGAASLFEGLAPLLLIGVIFYFFMIRPQQTRMKQHQAMIAAVRRGDTVVTAGGLVGKVTKVQDDGEILVEIAEGVKVRVVASTLATVRAKGEPAVVETK
jgi:preprotein translocase subunit YajC